MKIKRIICLICIVALMPFTAYSVSDVDSSPKLIFNEEYVKVGTVLSVDIENAETGINYSYSWKVNGKSVQGNENTYIPTEEDKEKFITATASGGAEELTATIFFSTLPVIYIDTENGNEITSKTEYVDADMKIQGNDEFNLSNTTLYDGITEIRGRGNSTWSLDKKPYKLKLDEKTDLFGMGSNKHWVLLANYNDKTGIRNKLTYEFSNEIGMEYYMNSVNVVLVLNGEYKGMYQFCEHVRIGDTRVNIYDWESTAEDVAKAIYKKEGLTKDQRDEMEELLCEDLSWITSGTVEYENNVYTISEYDIELPDADGGYLLSLEANMSGTSKFTTDLLEQPIQFESPEFANTNLEIFNYVKDYIDSFEQAILSDDFTTVYNQQEISYFDLFDMEQLINYWFVNEYSMNFDSMKNSVFLYKDVGGKMKMGPAWDYDWALGGMDGTNSVTYDKWHTKHYSTRSQGRQWYKYLIKDPYFVVQAYEKYNKTVKNVIYEQIKEGGKIEEYSDKYNRAATENLVLWNNGASYESAIKKLNTYLVNRYDWLNGQFASVYTLMKSLGGYIASDKVQITDVNLSDSETTKVSANIDLGKAEYVTAFVNGKYAGKAEVENSKVEIEIDNTLLVQDGESLNTVVLRAANSSQQYIKEDGEVVSNYVVFSKEKGVEITPTPTETPEPNITVGKVAGLKVKKAGKKALLTWKKSFNADKYEIYRCKDKSKGYVKVGSTAKLKFKSRKLVKGKKYYYKVRAYKKVNGEKIYGKYSKRVKYIRK